MIRTYVFRLDPTSRQADSLVAMLKDHCDLYNAALEERREAWTKRRAQVTNLTQQGQLPEIRANDPDQGRWSATSQQGTLRRLDRAFRNFFRRIRAGEKAGYPRFRSIHRFNSVDFRQSDGATFSTKGCQKKRATLRLKGVGVLKVILHRPLPAGCDIGHMTVKRVGVGRRTEWYVSIPVEVNPILLPATGRAIGIDFGIANLLTVSDPIPGLTDQLGHAANPRPQQRIDSQVRATQRALDRCQRNSRRRTKAHSNLAALRTKIRRQRQDWRRKAALAVIRHADVIALEDLRISNMIRRPKPQPDPAGGYLPNGAARKAGLNRAIHDAAWGMLTTAILDKAEEAGRVVVMVDARRTSQRCSKCMFTSADNRRSQERFHCVSCGYELNADRNAAINILRAGTAHREAA